MQRLSFALGIIFFSHSFSALAGDTTPGSYAISFGVGSSGGLSLKKVLSETNHVFFGFNLSRNQYQNQASGYGSTTSNDSSSRGYSILAGTRHFLEKDKLSKFFQLSIAGSHYTSSSSGYSSTTNSLSVMPGYGVEYFIAPDLSIEGVASLGFAYSRSSSDSNGTSQYSSSAKYYSFPVVGTALTYYW